MAAHKIASFKDPLLKKIVSALKEEFKPLQVYLFGSRAQGTSKKDSDYDFVVVIEKDKHGRLANMDRAAKALDHLSVKADVFVYSKEEFNEWKNELSSIPETAFNVGKEIELG
jgi:predicted nucleotidyltransferase